MKKRAIKKDSFVSHKQIIEITRPAYLLGLWGGVITLIISIFLLVRLFSTGNLFIGGSISFLEIAIFIHLLIGILMLISIYLLRQEHHSFGGSVMLLCTSIVGLNLASGLFIGPLLGVIAGILGISEHEKLIKHHLN